MSTPVEPLDIPHPDICNKLIPCSKWKAGIYCILGGLLGTPIGCAVAGAAIGSQLVLTAMICKYTCVGAGAGAGWQFGSPDAIQTLQNNITEPHLWRLIQGEFLSNDSPTAYVTEGAESYFVNTLTDLGKLYAVILVLFAERYEIRSEAFGRESVLMEEFQEMVELLVDKHPMSHMASRDEKAELTYIVERRLLRDLAPYLQCHYASYNQKLHDRTQGPTWSPLDELKSQSLVKINAKALGACIRNASMQFRHLPHEPHPRDKVSILVSMVKELARDLDGLGVKMSCDHLTPLVSAILLRNLDTLPGGEIAMVYDYLRNHAGEEGYTATVLMAALKSLYTK